MPIDSTVSRRELLASVAGAVGAALALPENLAAATTQVPPAQAPAPTPSTPAPSATSAQHPPLAKADLDRMADQVSNWGRWGKDDQLGTVNLITPAKRKHAVSLVKEGTSVSLSHALDTVKSDDNTSPLVQVMRFQEGSAATGGNSYALDTYTINYHGNFDTHMDALCHCFHDGHCYNGSTRDIITDAGAQNLSVANFKDGIVTRGVLFDIARLKGVPYLDLDDMVYPEDLEAWEKRAKVKLASGDAFLLRTGRWARRADKGPWPIARQYPGIHASCLPWLHERDIAVLASDHISDAAPAKYEGFAQPVHALLLSRMGTPMFDNADFEAAGDMANRLHRWEFLFVVAPLVVPKGTGSPVNPLAIF